MATVRISGNSRSNIHKLEWLGAPAIDSFNHIERTIELPEAAYKRIEEGIVQGCIEGVIVQDDGRRFEWFLDRGSPTPEPAGETTDFGCGEGI
jgi:hypothetical protein